jgi:hypothetical protein
VAHRVATVGAYREVFWDRRLGKEIKEAEFPTRRDSKLPYKRKLKRPR